MLFSFHIEVQSNLCDIFYTNACLPYFFFYIMHSHILCFFLLMKFPYLMFVYNHRQPNLYTLVVILRDASGSVVDCESCLVGIRKVSKAPKQLLVNGHPIIIRGVNRHEHHPRLGKTNIESCMVKVVFTFVLLFVHLPFCVLYLILILISKNTILQTGFGLNEAEQYQCCQEQPLSSTSPVV